MALEVQRYEQLPSYSVEHHGAILEPLIWSAEEKDADQPFMSSRSTSTYPIMPDGVRDGDPNADRHYMLVHGTRTLIAVADGCNWGMRPYNAAKAAISALGNYFIESDRISHIANVQEAGHYLLRAFSEAHNHIIKDKSDMWDAGTTTLLGCLILPLALSAGGPPPSPWGILCVSVGDCKAYRICAANKSVSEVTVGCRAGNLSDLTDPGGRLGPYLGHGAPDLRNLRLCFSPCEQNDLVMIVSDGVHDNFDPQTMGKTPKEAGYHDDVKWETLSHQDLIVLKQTFRNTLLSEVIFSQTSPASSSSSSSSSTSTLPSTSSTPSSTSSHAILYDINPDIVTERILRHCLETTRTSREWMEAHPGKRQPPDYRAYPGKMDHTTCVTYRVGHNHAPDQQANLVIPSPTTTTTQPSGLPIPGPTTEILTL
eukprot:TRINITY_DN2278_c1_g1_i3.p1 TRINITY_DN2278_c1_g1~~TRINITY_DN2278_c1_g1_i3.p1  ORF type:complete len:426 (-),score=78.94 TRINITY_DN2278_c1_g1_i3:30-1307(-)